MDTQLSREAWDEIGRGLRALFDPSEVDFRIQGGVNEQDHTALVVAYIDARTVSERLDAVVGPGNWSFNWDAMVIDKEIRVAKGTLTVYGVAKSDVGTASNTEPSKGCVSDALKRAAVQWGIGRYLHGMRPGRAAVRQYGKSWVIDAAALKDLRALLPRPGSSSTAAASGAAGQSTADPEPQPEPVREAPAPRPQPRPRPAPQPQPARAAQPQQGNDQLATDQQLASIHKLCAALGIEDAAGGKLTDGQARVLLGQLSTRYATAQRQRKAGQTTAASA